MKRRVLAILCVLSILMGMVVMPAAAETTATAQSDVPTTYSVGYSKVDISPLTDMNDDNTIIQVPMSGYSNSRERLATSIDEHIYSTCTAITDADGNTVLYFTLDCISPPNNLVADVRAAVVEALSGEGITADRIYINGSHSHEAPDFSTIKTAKTYYDSKATDSAAATNTTNYMADVTKGLGLSESITEEAYVELITQWSNYYWDTVIAGMAGAAEEALDDRRDCTMTKGQIDTGDYTATQLDSSSPFYNKPMNAVRHYKLTLTKRTIQQTREWSILTWGDWQDGDVLSEEVVSVNYRGDNFGSAVTKPADSFSNASYTSSTREKYTYVLTEENVNEADDVIYLIQFKPTDGSTPIVFANWRGHPSVNGGSDVTEVSSDYIDHFRSSLEAANLRPAFFLGTSGNINAHNKLDDWYTNVTDTDTFEQKNQRTQAYGEMLGQIAVYGLTNNMSGNLGCGTIRTMQSIYANTYNNPPKGLYEVAKALRDNTSTEYPATGTGSDGVSYTVDSWHNANNIVNRYSTTKTAFSEEVNAIMLGDSVAFVTSPNELFDYYNEDMSTAAADNKWFELNSEDTYGTPFIMGYTNGPNSYLPNKLAYTYENASGSTGSYESYASYYAAGGGEALIDQYSKMLNMLSSDAMTYKCQHCGEVVEWKPLFAGDANSDFTSGHYVLVEDLYGIGQDGQQVLGTSDGKTTVNVCLDLNGYTYSSESRCAIVYAGSTLNIMNMPGVDADGKAVDGKEGGTAGKMIGMTNSNNPGGGAFSVSAGATVNLYGGTLSFVKRDISVYGGTWGNGLGGVFYCSGTLNVYGGTIEGAEMQNEYRYKDNYIGAGGAVWLNAGAKLNMYGGRITSGSVPTGGAGPCVYLVGSNSKVTLSGDASIEDIYYRYSSDAAVTVSGTYTGTANLTFNDSSDTTFTDSITLAQNLDVGDLASGADISGATLSCSNTRADGTRWQVRASGSNLLLYGYEDATQAVIVNGNAETEYTSLADAISSYTSDGSNYIKLIKAPTDTAVTVSKETYLDLNGCNVNAAITATAAPLYVMDSMTNDYNVNDGYGYGKLTGALSGTVEGVPVESDVAVDGYLKVTESSDVSFHRVNLQIYATNIRAQSTDGTSYDPGMYYSIKEGFSADSVVANLINNSSNSDYYGIAMLADDGDSSNGKEIPSAATLKDDNHSKYYSFKAGNAQNAANGTLLSGILKETNNVLINRRNANITVYGSAYIKIGDQYMFGPCVEQSLRNLFVGTTVVVGSVELPQTPINNRTFLDSLNDTQWECLLGLYEKYQSMIDAWITDAGQENAFQAILNDAEYNALKILVVGNSHGLDATNLLYEVFEDQKQDGKYVTADGREYSEVVIGNLYHSGANMNQHYSWIDGDIEYSYDKIGTGDTTGEKWQHTVKDNCMDDALADEEWDIVVMQQMNHRSGIIGGDYTSVDDSNFNQANYQAVAKHIKEMCPDAKLAWHMVWTNPDEADFFSNESSTLAHPSVQDGTSTDWITNHNDWYGTDGSYVQSNLYAGIVNALKTKILNEDWLGYHIDYVLPSAVAVEYAQDILGCSDYVLYRDYTHMNNYGRLMVAYTWWAELMGYDSIGVDIIGEIPSTLDHGQSGKNENLTKNNAGNFVVTDDLKRIITRSVNYALDMNDSSLDNAYEIVEDNTISILGIGNSYTIDSMWMLGEVYQAENPGKTVQLGIAYKSGESLAGHVTNITGNSAVYDYLYWDSTSDKWTVSSEKMTLQQIIKAQKWEMVSMQQGSSGSGRPTTYNADIQTIQSYVETQLNYVPTYLWNMTWAYPEEDIATDNYTLETAPNASSFINYYGSSQATMYKAIMSTVQEKILPNATFEYLMPVGTAIQNANGTLTDHDLYRDYTHLSDLSRLMAAYTWYCELETVTLDEIQLTALPTVNLSSGSWYNGAARDLSDQELSLVINSVKDARTNNFETTDTSVYES